MELNYRIAQSHCQLHQNQHFQGSQNIFLHDMIVTIFSNKVGRQQTQEQIGKFYRIQKTYFYKERILLFYMINFLINNKSSKQSKINKVCQKIFKLFQECIDQFKVLIQNLEFQQIISKTQSVQNFSSNYHLLKQENLAKILNRVQNLKTLKMFYNNDQLQTFLDILLEKQNNNQAIQNIIFHEFEQIFQDKVIVQKVQMQKKIIQLTIVLTHQQQKQKHNQKQKQRQKQKQLLYKNFKFKIGQYQFAHIIQTNQQKYVYFQIKNFPLHSQSLDLRKTTRIINLFDKANQNEEVLESQGERSDDQSRSSQIVQDQEFYRISSKISTSCRKNSFNSGQKLISILDEQNLQSNNNLSVSINPGVICSQVKFQNPVSEIYTRSSSLQKGQAVFRDNLYTSIDLLAKLQINDANGISGNKRKKSCQNPRQIKNSSQNFDQSRLFSKIHSNLKINLYDQAKNSLFMGDFHHKSGENSYCQPNMKRDLTHEASKSDCFPFLQIDKKYGDNRMHRIKTFFKISNDKQFCQQKPNENHNSFFP